MEGGRMMGVTLSALIVFAFLAWITYWITGKFGPLAA
jgi:hypothetical protein